MNMTNNFASAAHPSVPKPSVATASPKASEAKPGASGEADQTNTQSKDKMQNAPSIDGKEIENQQAQASTAASRPAAPSPASSTEPPAAAAPVPPNPQPVLPNPQPWVGEVMFGLPPGPPVLFPPQPPAWSPPPQASTSSSCQSTFLEVFCNVSRLQGAVGSLQEDVARLRQQIAEIGAQRR
jgi:hypothetical protein